MMTPEETRARAERAAEWFNTAQGNIATIQRNEETRGWTVVPCDKSVQPYHGHDRALIAEAYEWGFRDPIPTEQEAVVWLIVKKGVYLYYNRTTKNWFRWIPEPEGAGMIPEDVNPVEEATRLGDADVKGEG